MGPFANPNEVYAFYSLPYCAPTEIETKRENLGALLKGDRPTKTRYDLKFRGVPAPPLRYTLTCPASCPADQNGVVATTLGPRRARRSHGPSLSSTLPCRAAQRTCRGSRCAR